MSKTSEEIQEERRQLRFQYGSLFDAVSEVLFRHDPAGVNFEVNTNEYEAEAGAILPKLKSCASVDDVRRVVHVEIVHWFDTVTAGPEARYDDIAKEIWQLWLSHSLKQKYVLGDGR